MSGKIYLLQENGSLQAMTERSYVTEERLQVLLRDYPDLLAGDQIDEENPRRWLLVSREVGVPVEEGGGDWMSLDHLFLDQDAIPTLVEVKRSSDTRIRREVVGQMLDYASNAVAYWSVDRLRAQLEAICKSRGVEPIESVAEPIGEPVDETAPALVELAASLNPCAEVASLIAEAIVEDAPATIASGDAIRLGFSAELDKIVPDHSGLAILELGCGTGLIGLRYAAKATSLDMVDASPAMLAVLRAKDEVRASHVTIHEDTLPMLVGQTLAPNSVDWIFSNMAFHHIEDIPALVEALLRLIKPGGRVTIGDLETETGTFHAIDRQ